MLKRSSGYCTHSASVCVAFLCLCPGRYVLTNMRGNRFTADTHMHENSSKLIVSPATATIGVDSRGSQAQVRLERACSYSRPLRAHSCLPLLFCSLVYAFMHKRLASNTIAFCPLSAKVRQQREFHHQNQIYLPDTNSGTQLGPAKNSQQLSAARSRSARGAHKSGGISVVAAVSVAARLQILGPRQIRYEPCVSLVANLAPLAQPTQWRLWCAASSTRLRPKRTPLKTHCNARHCEPPAGQRYPIHNARRVCDAANCDVRGRISLSADSSR